MVTREANRFSVVFMVLLALLIIIPLAGYAGVPQKINYQGYLTDSAGTPVDATVSMTFSLYDTATAVTPLWTETQNVTVSSGIYSVNLGEVTPFALPFDAQYYLGVTVGTDAEMTPRIPLTSVASALNADRLDGNDATAFAAATHVHGWSDLTGVPTDLADGDDDTLGGLSCANGQVAKWDLATTQWVCADDADTDTTYSAGTGLSLSGTTFNVAVPLTLSGSTSTGPIIKGTNTGSGYGVYGEHNTSGNYGYLGSSGYGVYGYSGSGRGVYGVSTSGYGVYGYHSSSSSVGILGHRNGGVYGYSTTSYAGYFEGDVNITGTLSSGDLAAGSTMGGAAISTGAHTTYTAGTGLSLSGTTFNVAVPLSLSGSSANPIIKGTNTSTGSGVYGTHSTSGNFGWLGGSVLGVYGYNSTYGNYGYLGGNSYGVYGKHNTSLNYGYLGSSDSGVFGINSTSGNYGYLGGSNYGVYGNASFQGVKGVNSGSGNWGVLGSVSYGAYGYAATASDYAGYFSGKVYISGNLTKGGGSFKIDHPLEPEKKYLQHSFVESPDMKNVYDGVAALDEKGEAWVELPDWFGALNRDFRYQLTPIGAPMPGLYIAEEVADNRFKIAGGVAGKKVSWQVTGIRQDPYAIAHPIQVEEDKPPEEVGFYLHPELYGQPKEKSIEWAKDPEGMQQMKEMRAENLQPKQ